MAKATSVQDRLATRRAAMDAKRRKKESKIEPEVDLDEVLGEIFDLDADFDPDEHDLEDGPALVEYLAKLKSGEEPELVEVDLTDKDSVIARLLVLDPRRGEDKLEPLSLKVLLSLLRAKEAKAKGDGAKGVNPPKKTEKKEKSGRKRTPPLPDKYGSATVSRATKQDLVDYLEDELELSAGDASSKTLRAIVEAHLRGEDLPEHDLAPTNADGAPSDDGPAVYLLGYADGDGDGVLLRNASDAAIAESLAHRTPNAKAGDYVDMDRDDLEQLALETYAAHAYELEAMREKQPTAGYPALAAAMSKALEAFSAALRGE